MYVNSEIIKRKEAVKIEVSLPIHPSWTSVDENAVGIYLQDIRDLVLHLIGDAPPVGWLKVEVSH